MTSIETTVQTIASELNEQMPGPRALIEAIVKALSADAALGLLREALQIEASGGMPLPDQEGRRTPGGVFFHLARERLNAQLPADEVRRIFTVPQHAKRDQRLAELRTRGWPAQDWSEHERLLAAGITPELEHMGLIAGAYHTLGLEALLAEAEAVRQALARPEPIVQTNGLLTRKFSYGFLHRLYERLPPKARVEGRIPAPANDPRPVQMRSSPSGKRDSRQARRKGRVEPMFSEREPAPPAGPASAPPPDEHLLAELRQRGWPARNWSEHQRLVEAGITPDLGHLDLIAAALSHLGVDGTISIGRQVQDALRQRRPVLQFNGLPTRNFRVGLLHQLYEALSPFVRTQVQRPPSDELRRARTESSVTPMAASTAVSSATEGTSEEPEDPVERALRVVNGEGTPALREILTAYHQAFGATKLAALVTEVMESPQAVQAKTEMLPHPAEKLAYKAYSTLPRAVRATLPKPKGY